MHLYQIIQIIPSDQYHRLYLPLERAQKSLEFKFKASEQYWDGKLDSLSGPPFDLIVDLNLIEIVLNQIGLIARLIEKNNFLYEVQMKQYKSCEQNTVTVN